MIFVLAAAAALAQATPSGVRELIAEVLRQQSERGGTDTWGYVLFAALSAAVVELWRRRLADDKEERRARAVRHETEERLRERELDAVRADAESRTRLSEVLQGLADRVDACPYRREDGQHIVTAREVAGGRG